LKKCFDGISKLKSYEGTKTFTAMISPEDEEVKFNKNVKATE
jgi:hypothetical protein